MESDDRSQSVLEKPALDTHTQLSLVRAHLPNFAQRALGQQFQKSRPLLSLYSRGAILVVLGLVYTQTLASDSAAHKYRRAPCGQGYVRPLPPRQLLL